MGNSLCYKKIMEHVIGLRRYAWILTRSRNDAEDLVQECLTRAITSASSLREGAPVRPWLFRILHNTHVSQIRRQQIRRGGECRLVDEEGYQPPQVSHVELQEVLKALDGLPESQRQAITLVALEALSYREAAETLGIPVGTLMSRLARGREALRQELDGQAHSGLRVVGGYDDQRTA